MARPREKNISKWGYWKRNQRSMPGKGKCANCGKPTADRHHRDGNQKNNSRGNLIRLCRSCHTRLENKRGGTRKGG